MAKLTVLLGAPGAGKSTYASRLGTVVTTDASRGRRELGGETLHQAYRQINALLAQGKDVVFDTTGANPAVRKAAATIARNHGARLEAHVLDTPLAACLDAQKGRSNPVAAADVRRIHGEVQKAIGGLSGEGFGTVRFTTRKK